ncbi:MAG: hypothetical protein AVDCRST_MAG64-2889, partial [uncultured Phycisphaerae bacterium]
GRGRRAPVAQPAAQPQALPARARRPPGQRRDRRQGGRGRAPASDRRALLGRSHDAPV